MKAKKVIGVVLALLAAVSAALATKQEIGPKPHGGGAEVLRQEVGP
jgi:hypothetical protein